MPTGVTRLDDESLDSAEFARIDPPLADTFAIGIQMVGVQSVRHFGKLPG